MSPLRVQFGRIPGVIGVTSLSGRLSTPPRLSAVILPPFPIHIAPDPPASPPLPSTRWISGFPKGADTAASLPLLMRMKLRVIADWIVQCIQPGAFPIVKISAIGHAELREPFALAVSWKRAAAVLAALQNEIRDSFSEVRIPLIPFNINLPSPNDTIQFKIGLHQRTADPPGDPEDPPEPVIFNTPSFTKGPDHKVPEDAGPQTVPNWATNIGAVPPVTFKVTANTNPRLFSAGPAVDAIRSAGGEDTGTLTYTPATHARGSATITLVLRDSGTNITPNSNTGAPQSFKITVGS